ncbi:MAG TPA: YdeI/OmpD-associated family protein [Bacteroidia bacterium]|nr:YdeI/OmpD-associated family protein [Bacteroidia bacterium]
MHCFNAALQKFSSKAEKTGWTYVEMPFDIERKLKLKSRREFRIKGKIDDVKIERLVCYPMKGEGFIIALNAELRKKLGKREGAIVSVKFVLDKSAALKSQELLDCLETEPEALKQFNSLLLSHQNYFHRYVYTAKGADTRAGRIVNVIHAMYKKMNFGEMVRSLKAKS